MSSSKFPVPVPSDLSNLTATHDVVEYTPGDLPHLAFSIVLPKGWAFEDDLGEQRGGIGQIAILARLGESTPNSPAIIQLMMSNVPMEIPLRDWVQYQAAQQGIELETVEDQTFVNGPGIDAGGVTGPADRRHVVRIICVADSARIFMLMAMVSIERYEQVATNLALALYSFKLLNASGNSQLEQWATIEGGEPAIRMALPGSWDIREVASNLPGKTGFDLFLANDETMMAYLRVKAANPEQVGAVMPDQALETAFQEMTESGVTLLGPIEDDVFYLKKRKIAGLELAKSGTASTGGADVHYRISFLRRDGLDFSLTLLAPLRSDDVITWMRAKRVYEMAFMTLESA